jgi:phosphoserine phosphatase RsbX
MSTSLIDWGVSARTMAREAESGDLHVVARSGRGILVAAIDGLGHGAKAALAARIAGGVLEDHAGESPRRLVERCHAALRSTRGVVLSLAAIDVERDLLTWLGIGNVEARLFRADRAARPASESILLRSGVVGYQLPPLRETSLPIMPGDTLVFATDGIRHDFGDASPLDQDPRAVAEDILDHHRKNTDDALVLVVKYLGAAR